MDQVPTLESLAFIRIAVDVCLRPDVLQRIMDPTPVSNCCTENVWISVYHILMNPVALGLKLPSILQEQVLNHIMPVAMRAMYLIQYHENIFGLTRNEIIRCLDRSVFTSQGLIDHVKLGRKLVTDEELSVLVKYRLSCFYFLEGSFVDSNPCIGNLIPYRLWQDLTLETREFFRAKERVSLVRNISQVLHQVVRINKRFSPQLSLKIFKAAVRSGSVLAVKYTWENLSWRHKRESLGLNCLTVLSLITNNDGISIPKQFGFGQIVAPNDYYLEILFFLISKMNDKELEDFVKQDVEENGRCKSLEFLLRWPHQKRFIEMAELIKKVMPQQHFLLSLLRIVNKIEPKCMYSTNEVLGSTGTEDYRLMLREFWVQSNSHSKRDFFRGKNIQGTVLATIIGLDNFTYLDKENFKMILEDATTDEKRNVFNEFGLKICHAATRRRKFHLALWFLKACCPNRNILKNFIENSFTANTLKEILESLVQYLEFTDLLLKECFDTEEEISSFKMFLPCNYQMSTFYILISRDWQIFLDFMKWCFDTDEELANFKRLSMVNFSRVCNTLICNSSWQEVELLITWVFSTETEIEVYKRCVHLPTFAERTIRCFIESARFQEAETYVHWLGLSESEIRELKHKSILNFNNITSLLTVLLFNDPRTYGGPIEEGEGNLPDESFSDEGSAEVYLIKDPSVRCIERCGGRIEAVELILRWFLTDEHVTRQYQRLFHDEYAPNFTQEDEQTAEGLAIFDQVIRDHLLDLTA